MGVDALRRVPPWGWLAAIVLASFLLRAWLARAMVGPFIMVDELIYAELARSFADGDGFRVRDAPASGFSVVYPVVISPAYALFDSLPNAYAAVKTINALVMSLAAVPAYLLARTVVRPPLALAAAVLAVALPSMAYTGTVITENLFYPLFLVAVLALVRVLELPSPSRLAVLLGVLALCVLTRLQALALVPAVLVAPPLLALLQGRPLRAALRPFALLYAGAAAGLVLLVGAQAARGGSLTGLLGAYAIVGERSYDPVEVARFTLYHLAELDLYLGVLPVAALVLLVALVRRFEPPVARFLAAALPALACTVILVAAFASEFANRIQERYTFVVAPLVLIALLAWVERGAPRPRALAVGAAVGAALLPLTIPYERFIETAAISDTLALLPLWDAYGSLLLDSVDATVLAGGLLAALLFLLVPGRYALVLPAATLLFLAAVSHNVWRGEYGFPTARVSAGALFTGIRVGERDWIDRALPDGATAAFVWTGVTDRFAVNQNEFFNRQVGRVYYIGGPTPGGLAETEVELDERTGELRTAAAGEVVEADYVLTEDVITPDGSVVARDPGIGITLWRVDGPVVATRTEVVGLYPNDTWSGREVTWTRERCRGGTLTVTLASDPQLFDEDQLVTAFVAGEEAGRARVAPIGETELRVRAEPVDGTCTVRFVVERTKVPGGGDERELGVHFNTFGYEP
ncbi:MAG TPA: glycosyltransferase family 39 protein [Gaiellaceae bacterium]|nr:glycosyltransferase family 39 protein [Gaiellaceae bacterium]